MKLPTIDEWNAAHDSNRKMIPQAEDHRAVADIAGTPAEKHRLAQANRLMRLFDAKTMAELELGMKMLTDLPKAKGRK